MAECYLSTRVKEEHSEDVDKGNEKVEDDTLHRSGSHSRKEDDHDDNKNNKGSCYDNETTCSYLSAMKERWKSQLFPLERRVQQKRC